MGITQNGNAGVDNSQASSALQTSTTTKVTARAWLNASMARVVAAKDAPPPGTYFTVEFQTTFASGRAVIEKISFRDDEDNVWRPSGYSLR